jgi:hypothetical protein
MEHLLLFQNGFQFISSHDFQDLLVGQMLKKWNVQEPRDFVLRRKNRGENGEMFIWDFVLRRKNRGENGDVVMWPDYSIDVYFYQPDCLEISGTVMIPKLSMPKGMLCDLEELEWDQDISSKGAIANRMIYATVALILIGPFQDIRIFS